MMKIYTLCAVALMCCLASCSSIQTLTFDQLCPATVNFPERVRNVAVVNNMPATPEAKRTLLTLGEMNGNGKKSAEMLASSLADSKYFNQVMICDSALNDTHFAGRRILTQKEVQQLAGELDADLIFHWIRSVSRLSVMNLLIRGLLHHGRLLKQSYSCFKHLSTGA